MSGPPSPHAAGDRAAWLDFVIAGTPRSGTTLVTRLATDLAGVEVPPETHVLSRFLPRLLDPGPPRLDDAGVRRALEVFMRLPTSRGLRLDAEDVVRRVPPAATPLDLFEAVVTALTPHARLRGEKTPEHLAWWRRLTRARPDLKLVAVVRDPRAVLTSHRRTPWGIRPAVDLAQHWRADSTAVLAARDELGPARCLVLRYEDVVAAPAQARRRIATLLGTADEVEARADRVVHDWEWWKRRAEREVQPERADAWRDTLPPDDDAVVSTLCGELMERLGYVRGPARPLSPWQELRRRRYRARRRYRLSLVERAAL